MTGLESTSPSLVSKLCGVAATYGIGFGVWTLPVGFFVGPQVLVVALAHIVVGTLFWVARAGMRRSKAWGFGLASVLALLCSAVGALAIYPVYLVQNLAMLLFWGIFTLFFACLAVISFWQVTRRERRA